MARGLTTSTPYAWRPCPVTASDVASLSILTTTGTPNRATLPTLTSNARWAYVINAAQVYDARQCESVSANSSINIIIIIIIY